MTEPYETFHTIPSRLRLGVIHGITFPLHGWAERISMMSSNNDTNRGLP